MAPSGTAGIREAPRRLPAARRRTQLLDTAADLLAEGHVERLTMEGIATQAGVSKALCYRYFDNADELLLALAEREMLAVADRVRAAMGTTVTFEGSVRASLAAWFDVLSERGPVLVALLSTPRLAGDLGERRRALRATVGEFYSRQAAVAFDLDPDVAGAATVILLAGIDGLVDCWVARAVPRRELVDIFTTICLAAYRALADEPPVIG
jgi:AcrR family transcriptional regulator